MAAQRGDLMLPAAFLAFPLLRALRVGGSQDSDILTAATQYLQAVAARVSVTPGSAFFEHACVGMPAPRAAGGSAMCNRRWTVDRSIGVGHNVFQSVFVLL